MHTYMCINVNKITSFLSICLLISCFLWLIVYVVCVCVCVYTFIFPFIFISWRLITLHIVVFFVDMNLYTHINGHLDCFHVFAFVNSAAINIRVHVSF